MADPGYGNGAPDFVGSRTVRVPLREDLSHDVEGMIKADPNASYFVCNPNNPTGSLTSPRDIEYLLANKKRGSVVLVDEAYEYTEKALSVADLVASDRDVVLLRTFSKIYGMAGLRAGYALGRPDLLAKLKAWGDGKLPITGLVAANASLRTAETLIPERRAINARIREGVFSGPEDRKIPYLGTETNYFMMEVHRRGEEFARAMAKQDVIIGRVWPAWPTKVRITIGTHQKMDRFLAAWD